MGEAVKDKKRKIHIATPDEVDQYGAASEDPAPDPDRNAEEQPRGETVPEDDAPASDDGNDPAEPAGDETPLQQAERERDEYKDKWLRAQAEAQNQARRLRLDREEAVRFATADFARALLGVVDDFERTLEAAEDGSDAEALVQGVRIVYDHLLKVLHEHHVTGIESVGQPFDPSCHEALTQQPSDEHPQGTVMQEVQRGYRLHDRVLRPARVIISSGPASETDAAASGDNEE